MEAKQHFLIGKKANAISNYDETVRQISEAREAFILPNLTEKSDYNFKIAGWDELSVLFNFILEDRERADLSKFYLAPYGVITLNIGGDVPTVERIEFYNAILKDDGFNYLEKVRDFRINSLLKNELADYQTQVIKLK